MFDCLRSERSPRFRFARLALCLLCACRETTKPNGLDVQTEGETISLGFFHTCGISTQGAAYCWGGYESLDLVGDGAVKVQTTPTAIAGGQAFSQISAGGRHTCALTSSGTAFCWGSNYVSQLGDGTTEIRSSPVAVSGGHIFRQIDSGSLHTCGITTLGAVYCWGDNAFGRLGTGTTTSSAIAAPVAGALTFARISTGATHACGLTTSGAAVCWGRNELLALGDGTREPFRSSPTVVAGGHTFTQIVSGNEYSCALTPSGAAYCWGHGAFGRLGNGSGDEVSTPTAVAGGLSFKRISVGSGHAAAITHAGAAYAWGTNWQGQLGDGTQEHRYTPVRAAIGLIFK